MLSLEEAIKRCEEVAEGKQQEGFFRNTRANAPTVEGSKCYECATEHRQLAEWLRELRELRRNRIGRVSVGCATCIHMKTDDYTKRPCDRCCNNYFSKYESEVNADEDSD